MGIYSGVGEREVVEEVNLAEEFCFGEGSMVAVEGNRAGWNPTCIVG